MNSTNQTTITPLTGEYRNNCSDTPSVVIPKGHNVVSIEHLLSCPSRKRAAVQVHDVSSFCRYFAIHNNWAHSRIYADVNPYNERFHVVAVLDDHGQTTPSWREHTCTLIHNTSVKWRLWTGAHKSPMSQADFATFIEDNMSDIVEENGMPSGSAMLQMALSFERTSNHRRVSKINLQSGSVRTEYVDDDNADTRTSKQICSSFMINIPVFDGVRFDGVRDYYKIEARWKCRERRANGKLVFWFELIRPDISYRNAADDELQKISEATGVITIINGIYNTE